MAKTVDAIETAPVTVGRGFRIYIGVMLFVITLLLAILVASLVYGASRAQTINTKLNDFSDRADSIDKNLQQLNANLQSSSNSSLPPGY